MPVLDSNEMEVFSLALAELVAKASRSGLDLSAEEIARRMLIVQAARVYDPDDFQNHVLADPFPDPQKTSGVFHLWESTHFR